MNKEAIDLLILKQPELKSMRAKLEAFQPGVYCLHRSWGIGQIKAYDAKENKLIIDFEEDRPGHAMDPGFCADKLDVLPADNILVRQRTDPQAVEEMIGKPGDLIVEILQHCPDQAATSAELERLLLRLLGENQFKKWWTQTKRTLIKDPRVKVPGRKSDPFQLRDEPVKAEDEILDEFFEIKAPKKKVHLAEKLITLAIKHEDIKDRLPEILKSLTASIQETKALNLGERLYGVWIRNDLARTIEEDVDSLQPTSASILRESDNLSELAEQIPSSHYKRLLSLVERVFAEEWNKLVFDLLKNSEGKLTNECINFLMEKKCGAQLEATLLRWQNEHALKGPLLIWIIRNRHSRKFTKMLSSMVSPRLLAAVFYAIDYEALQNAGNRRILLADILSDDTDLIPELLSEATPETARDLATTLLLNQGFDELSKKSLLARFIKLFPNIQELAGESGSQRPKGLIVSKPSLEARKIEYDNLVKVRIPENKIAIATAREHGDLRENAEYKMARQEQDTMLARKTQLENDLARAQTTDFSDAPTDVVGIGCVVDLRRASTGEVVSYSILGAWDSDPQRRILSYQTPLAASLLSRKVGEAFALEVEGHRENYVIEKIRRWLDVAR